MKCAIMQPTYFPWIGYFSLIDAVDVFVFLDNVKIEKHSWHVRNKIKTANGPIFLTVPVNLPQGRMATLINEARLSRTDNWQERHLKSLMLTYKRSPFFAAVFPVLQALIETKADVNLADFNIKIITTIAKKLGIATKFVRASELTGVEGEKDLRLISICRRLKCQEYLSPIGSACYIDKLRAGGQFPTHGVKLRYHNFEHPAYNQMYDQFLPYMSVVDLLFNCGFEKSLQIIRSGRKRAIHYKKIYDMTKKYKLRKNRRDGFYQVYPIPTKQEVEKYYLDEFYSTKYKQFNDSALGVQQEEREFFARRWQRIFDVCRKYLKKMTGKSLFDIGCGYAQSLLYFRKRGLIVSGLETAGEAVKHAASLGLPVFQSEIEKFGHPQEKHDIVMLLNVLEHLRNPLKSLVEIRKKFLKRGGILVIDVPNEFNDFQTVANEEFKLNEWWVCPPNHINYFSVSSLSRLLKRAGYQILEKEASFPMEMFLLFGDVYVGNNQLGKKCHARRELFEKLMIKHGKGEKLYKFFNALAELELGRQIVIYARSN